MNVNKFIKENGDLKQVSENDPLPVKMVGSVNGESMEFLNGETNPQEENGSNGDVYINTSNGKLFKKEEGKWSDLMTLKGDDGTNGTDGTNGIDGDDGADGFPTEQQWDDLVARVDALENS